MEETFGAKWYKPFGKILEGNDYGEVFLLWCEKTEILSKTQWLDGFAAIERKMIADAGNGRDSFPPSTPAEFIAMAKSMKADAAGSAAQSFKVHPNIAIAEERRKRLEAPGAKEKLKKKGNDTTKYILDGF